MIPEKEFEFERIYECKDCPLGHKCGFAAPGPDPCPFKEYNSHFNQTTCQECDPYFGEYCPEGSGSFEKSSEIYEKSSEIDNVIKIVKDAIHDKLVTQCFEKDEYNSKNELTSGRHFDGGFKAYQLARPACAELCKKMPNCKGFHYDNFRTQRLCVIALFTKELDSY